MQIELWNLGALDLAGIGKSETDFTRLSLLNLLPGNLQIAVLEACIGEAMTEGI